MQRDLHLLSDHTFDVLIVGAGVHGAIMAWDAAQRGLSVALIERNDFGGATSANSLKTVHGGLRYLQDADLGLVRKMIHERSALLRIAPHMVHPLPIVMPTYNQLMKHKLVMGLALIINDLIGMDRNQGLDPGNQLPASKAISREECLELLPGVASEGITGGVVWYDGQMYNTERLTLAFVQSAEANGAVVANYLQAVEFLIEEEKVCGARVKDTLDGEEFDVRAKLVINAAGPWVDQLLQRVPLQEIEPKFHHSLAMNLVTRQFISGYAAGIPSRPQDVEDGRSVSKKSRMLFISPWRDYSLVGTFHDHFQGDPDAFVVREETIAQFIEETNGAYPEARLRVEDVCLIHRGFLPEAPGNGTGDVKLVRKGQIYDHQREDGLPGLITVVGVKYTSARSVAERAVNLAEGKLVKPHRECRTDVTPVHGGEIGNLGDFLAECKANDPAGWGEANIRRLVYNYGSAYPRLLDLVFKEHGLGEKVSPESPVLRAEVVYAVRNEMAQKLSDVVLRRTELGSAGLPEEAAIRCCADLMGGELGWDKSRQEQEIGELKSRYVMIA